MCNSVIVVLPQKCYLCFSVASKAVSVIVRYGLGRKCYKIDGHPSEDDCFLYELVCQQPGRVEVFVLCLKPSMKF